LLGATLKKSRCFRHPVDVIVLRIKSGKQIHGCYDAWTVTTSIFTKAAHEAVEKLNIHLINGLMLDDRLRKWKTNG
jgi:restriction system protein